MKKDTRSHLKNGFVIASAAKQSPIRYPKQGLLRSPDNIGIPRNDVIGIFEMASIPFGKPQGLGKEIKASEL